MKDAKNSIELIESNYQNISIIIQNLLKEYNYSDILLLAPTWKIVNDIKILLPQEIQKNTISTKEINQNKMIFSTYHSSKGIEAKVALVVDIDKIKDRKLLYVASTRASHKLFIHSQNFNHSFISQEIFDIVNNQIGKNIPIAS